MTAVPSGRCHAPETNSVRVTIRTKQENRKNQFDKVKDALAPRSRKERIEIEVTVSLPSRPSRGVPGEGRLGFFGERRRMKPRTMQDIRELRILAGEIAVASGLIVYDVVEDGYYLSSLGRATAQREGAGESLYLAEVLARATVEACRRKGYDVPVIDRQKIKSLETLTRRVYEG